MVLQKRLLVQGQRFLSWLIPAAAGAWGLPVSGCTASEAQRIVDALSEGKLVVAIMSKGHFTSGGHFIVLRGVKDGKIMVADPASYSRSEQLWDLSIIVNRGQPEGRRRWTLLDYRLNPCLAVKVR